MRSSARSQRIRPPLDSTGRHTADISEWELTGSTVAGPDALSCLYIGTTMCSSSSAGSIYLLDEDPPCIPSTDRIVSSELEIMSEDATHMRCRWNRQTQADRVRDGLRCFWGCEPSQELGLGQVSRTL